MWKWFCAGAAVGFLISPTKPAMELRRKLNAALAMCKGCSDRSDALDYEEDSDVLDEQRPAKWQKSSLNSKKPADDLKKESVDRADEETFQAEPSAWQTGMSLDRGKAMKLAKVMNMRPTVPGSDELAPS